MFELTRIKSQMAGIQTFLFIDVEGSTVRWAKYPAEMGKALAQLDILMCEVVGQARGKIFKSTGDGACAVFRDVASALTAAADLQQRLATQNFATVGGIKLRAGVHCGPAEFRDGDYFGLSLNHCARLMNAGHGGQVLVSAAAASAVEAAGLLGSGSLRRLGLHRIKDLAEAVDIFQLAGPGLEAVFPPLRALDARPNNLPLQLSPLIGREAELSELRLLIAGRRLVTLLGAGGVGKTRLSLQAAADALSSYPEGVWLVELAGLDQPEQVATAAAAALNIALTAQCEPAEQLAAALRGATMLIILDNCEHLIDAAALTAAALLRHNSGVTILTTSRSPLGVPGEQIFSVPNLPVPEAAGITVQAAAGYAAIQLFVDRATLVQPNFTLDKSNAEDIAAICQRLDGIALAIELAAARIRLMTPKSLLDRLSDRFRLLTSAARTVLPRQRTLRALIDWSYDLLSEIERVALCRLSVFAGSFNFAGAEAVIPDKHITTVDVLELVTNLLDKSLITLLPVQNREPRYRLLDSTRQYALEKLAQAGETAALYRAHAQHMIAVFGEGRRRWADTKNDLWRAEYEPEVQNLFTALAWAFGGGGDAEIAVALSARLRPLITQALITNKAYRAYIRAAVPLLTPNTPQEDAAWLWHLTADNDSSGTGEAAILQLRARDLFAALGDRLMAGMAASFAASMLAHTRDAMGVRRLVDEARSSLAGAPRNIASASILHVLGMVGKLMREDGSDVSIVLHDLEGALSIFEDFNDCAGISNVSSRLSDLDADLGDYDSAIKRSISSAVRDRAGRHWGKLTENLTNQVRFQLLAGNDAAAKGTAQEAAPFVAEYDDQDCSAAFIESLALLAARAGALELAAKLAGRSNRFYVACHQIRPRVEQRVWNMLMTVFARAEAFGKLAGADRDRLMEAGAALQMESAISLGLTA